MDTEVIGDWVCWMMDGWMMVGERSWLLSYETGKAVLQACLRQAATGQRARSRLPYLTNKKAPPNFRLAPGPNPCNFALESRV